jgi:hypothetical protein
VDYKDEVDKLTEDKANMLKAKDKEVNKLCEELGVKDGTQSQSLLYSLYLQLNYPIVSSVSFTSVLNLQDYCLLYPN